MKRVYFFLNIFFMTLPVSILAQQVHEVKADLFSLSPHADWAYVSYEWSFHSKWSVGAGAKYHWRNLTGGTPDVQFADQFSFKWRRMALQFDARFYPLGNLNKPVRRLFGGVFYYHEIEMHIADNYDDYTYQRYGYRSQKENRIERGPGAYLGYKWLIRRKIPLEIWYGIYRNYSGDFSILQPLAAINAGYRFSDKR